MKVQIRHEQWIKNLSSEYTRAGLIVYVCVKHQATIRTMLGAISTPRCPQQRCIASPPPPPRYLDSFYQGCYRVGANLAGKVESGNGDRSQYATIRKPPDPTRPNP